jgi:hypothetical protein
MPTIDVAGEPLRDEETPVRVTGLDPGVEVELLARSDSWYDDGCESRAVFEADDEGVVDTAGHAPVDGDYEEVEPMGWLWSLAPEDSETSPSSDREPVEIALEARVDGGVRAEVTTVRRPSDPAVEHRQVDENVVGDLFLPASAGPHPGVLVLHGSGGHPSRGVASLLASRGYAAFALQYFGDSGALPDGLVEVPVEYFDDAAAWLGEHDAVADGPVGLYGTSKGAEAALVVAARFDWPDAVVAVAPAAHRWQATDQSIDREAGSWTADGDVLPYVPFRAPPGNDAEGRLVLGDVYEGSLPRVPDERIEAARIPVEDIGADVLLVAGGDDGMWPSAVYAATLADRLDDRPDARVRTVTREDAGHGIRPPYLPMAGSTGSDEVALGGTPAANARLGADYWPQALDLFDGAFR